MQHRDAEYQEAKKDDSLWDKLLEEFNLVKPDDAPKFTTVREDFEMVTEKELPGTV